MAHLNFTIFLLGALATIVAAGTLDRGSNLEQRRLIRISETEDPKWLTQEEIMGLIQNRIGFMDVTDRRSKLSGQRESRRAFGKLKYAN